MSFLSGFCVFPEEKVVKTEFIRTEAQKAGERMAIERSGIF
jgi:hypothetical protein